MDLEASIVGNWSIRTAQTQCHLRGSRSRAWLVLKCCNCATVENERRCYLCIAFRPKPGLELVSPGLSPVLRYPASGASLLQGGVARDTQLWRRAHAKNSLPVMGPGEITDPESIESRSPALPFAGACKCDEREQAAFRGDACVPKSLAAVKSPRRVHRAPFGSLFVSKGRTLDHRRSEQQQAPVAESLELPPAKHGGEEMGSRNPHLHDRTRLEHSGRHSTPPGWRYRLAIRFAISKETSNSKLPSIRSSVRSLGMA